MDEIDSITLDKTNLFRQKIILRRKDGSVIQIRNATPDVAEKEFYAVLSAWNQYKEANK